MDTSEVNNNAVEEVASYLSDTAVSPRGSLRMEEKHGPPASPLQALIIGIDKYSSPRIRNLEGAVADANAVDMYLRSELKVPEEQIVNLRDENATRAAIVGNLRALSSMRRGHIGPGSSEPVSRDDPFLIYYAGHGASGPAPDGWVTETDKISMLVPHDGSAGGSQEEVTRNIPDRAIGALLHELAEVRGDNITVIFDCCYSGSGTRESERDTPRMERGFELDEGTMVPSTLDEDIWGKVYEGRASGIPSGLVQSGTRSHVLLAACGENEKAYEGYQRGIFTQVLLEELRKVKADKITYRDLMRRIDIPIQTPQCEGHNVTRLLFNALSPSTGRIFYDVTLSEDKYSLHAGSLHGVTEGAIFSIRASRDFHVDSPSLASMIAKDVSAFRTELSCAAGDAPPGLPQSPLFAFQTVMGRAEALRLHISPSDKLESVIKALAMEILPYHRADNHILLGDKAQADLSVRSSQEGVEFLIHNSRITYYGLDKLSQSVPPVPQRVQSVLRAAAHFFWHLRRAPDKHSLRQKIHVSFHRVEEDMGGDLDENLRRPFRAVGDNLIVSGAVEVEADNKTPYGMTVHNGFNAPMCIWAFYFDCSNLSISEYYKPPNADPMARGDPSLPGNKRLPIGHGSGGVRPFKYFLQEGSNQNIDVGLIKLFISTRKFDLEHVAQPSPFVYKTPRTSDFVDPLPETVWDTILIPVVQRRPS
ncbi:hypothetical protein PENSPDRAFT_754732 [Peniophora sp. CONT]|nr:hypothetical protein PENSPDRAFT_754732 [Peniophora sp. CONT]